MTGDSPATAKKRFHVDVFSPPVLLGCNYLLLFGVGIIDVLYFDGRTRLRSSIQYFKGLTPGSLEYLALTYVFFVAGYFVTPAAAIGRHVRPAPRHWLPNRTSIATTAFFLITFGVLVAYTLTVGYGRYGGTGGEALANLSIFGELSAIPYAISLVRAAQHRAGLPGAGMSRFDRGFLWFVMTPAQILLSVLIGTRTRAVIFSCMAFVAFHYGYKPIPAKKFTLMGAVLLFVAVPLLGYLRDINLDVPIVALPGQSSSYSARAWESVAGRTSAVETFTVIYDNVDRVPTPDPMSWALTTGLVPRFLWPSKPQYTFTERLTLWAVGLSGVNWMGPTLPGELFLLRGYVGGLLFMMLLGGLWRGLREMCRVDQQGVWLSLYVVVMSTLLNVEVGFIVPYASMTRFVLVTVIVVFATTRRVGQADSRGRAPAARIPLQLAIAERLRA